MQVSGGALTCWVGACHMFADSVDSGGALMFAEALDKVGSQPELVSWEARRSTALRVRVRY